MISMLLFMLISISTFPSEIVSRITNIKYLPSNINNATGNSILRSIQLTWQNKLAIKLVTITTILNSISIIWIGWTEWRISGGHLFYGIHWLYVPDPSLYRPSCIFIRINVIQKRVYLNIDPIIWIHSMVLHHGSSLES